MSQFMQTLVVFAVVLVAAVYLVRRGLRRRRSGGACANCAAQARTTRKRPAGSH